MEDNRENRLLFFAAFYGCEIYNRDTTELFHYKFKDLITTFEDNDLSQFYIKLKKVKNISVEDSIIVGKILTKGIRSIDKEFNYGLHGRLHVVNDEKQIYKDSCIEVIDFLRKNKYATQFHAMAVEEYTNLGWCDLII